MVNYPLVPPSKEDVVGLALYWWLARQSTAGNGVLPDTNDPNGLKVTRTNATTVAIAAGHYSNKGVWKAYAGGSIDTIPAAAAGKHRYDAICVTISTDTMARVAGTEAVPDTAADFLENFTPLPPDLNSTDYLVLGIICVDEAGIRTGNNGTYSTAGVADMRPPLFAGLDDTTLKISAAGKLEVQGNTTAGLILSDVVGSRPAFGTADRFFWATDEHILYRDTGSAWVKAAVADHADLDGVGTDDHHAQSHTGASHSDIESTGANIDSAVSLKHTQGTDQKLDDSGDNEISAEILSGNRAILAGTYIPAGHTVTIFIGENESITGTTMSGAGRLIIMEI